MRTARQSEQPLDRGVLAIWVMAGSLVLLVSAATTLSAFNVFGGSTGVVPTHTFPPPAVAAASPIASARPAATVAPAVAAPAAAQAVPSVSRAAIDVPAAIARTAPALVALELETKEVRASVDKDQTYAFWTFGGTVPGPFLRVRLGDTVELRLRNAPGSTFAHSIDLHAVTGPGGGAGVTQVDAGKEKIFRWQALNPGLYVYHCATAPIPVHVANGMYGLILVEPEGGLPAVDREFYVMQGELYTNTPFGVSGHKLISTEHLLSEHADYVLFNGKVGALTGDSALTAKVGETIRIYFGVGGFLPSSFHVIGEIFDRVYREGAVGSEPARNVQTTLVPAGGAVMVEFRVDVPGTYVLVDHALTRALNKGAAGHLVVTGPADPAIFSGDTTAAH